jgi:cell division initiation protein
VKITPLDVRKHQFRKALRGYDADEVRVFLDLVAKQMEETLKENAEQREQLSALQIRVAEYEKLESTLRDTLLTAERAASQCKENAEREARLVIREAEYQAQKTVEQGRAALAKVREELLELSAAKEAFGSKFRALLEAQRKVLDMYEADFAEGPLQELAAEEEPQQEYSGDAQASRSA